MTPSQIAHVPPTDVEIDERRAMTPARKRRIWEAWDGKCDFLMERVQFDPFGGCWLWSAIVTPRGYGQFRFDGEHLLAHRASWLAFHGELPPSAWVLHRCDVRACVNPNHLFLGDHAANMADMVLKGRKRRFPGELHHNAKLTEDQAREIISRLHGGEGPAAIARAFGLRRETISAIKQRRSWVHLARPA